MIAPLAIGQPVPDIQLPSTEGRTISLLEFIGKKNVVLYFYPEDDTPGCTAEACGFRDDLPRFVSNDTVILGVSTDTLDAHLRFKSRYNLPFTLISDPGGALSRWFGVFDERAGESRRVTFLIGKDGLVKHVLDKVDVRNHANEVFHLLPTR